MKYKMLASLETFNDFIPILFYLPVPVIIAKDKLIEAGFRDDMVRMKVKFKPCLEQSFSCNKPALPLNRKQFF